VEEINAAGGINGRMLELIAEDSKCTAADGILAYKKLTEVDGVKIILGTTCSGSMLGAAPLAEEDGVVLFLRIRHQSRHRGTRRLHLPDSHQRPPARHRHGQYFVGR
jgi:ABC-type branched-subunit amino acid transport system substrate-binding protein